MHSTFWDNWEDAVKLSWFLTGIGDYGISDRVIPRRYIESKGYKSILDIACGPCIDFEGFQKDGYDIDYTGIDSSQELLSRAPAETKVVQGDVEELPFPDNSFDVSYARHIIEHIPGGYEKVINEAIRVAKHDFILVLFRRLRGDDEVEDFEYDEEKDVYHHDYLKSKLVKFITDNPKVESIEWPEDTHSGLINPTTEKGVYTGYILFIHLKDQSNG